MKKWIFILFLLLLAGAALFFLNRTDAAAGDQKLPLVGLQSNSDSFARAKPGRIFSFPRDHGPHPDFQTEWWYYTGNLKDSSGREFGFQLTFFRRALAVQTAESKSSDWRSDQVYLGHFALTDVQDQRFRYFERFSRGAAGLAGAVGEPQFKVWLDDWQVEQVGNDQYRLFARAEDISLELNLLDRKGPVLQGKDGYSQKGPDAGNASYYYSQTRLEAEGTVTTPSGTYAVKGLSWMDHEFSTSALGPDQVGWDWFSIQLDDGSEVMLFTLRNQEGEVDGFSSGTLIGVDGSTRSLTKEDFEIETSSTWKSADSGGKYPSGWQISIPSAGLTLNVQPKLRDQELQVSFIYWEGAVGVTGERDGKPVRGNGYVELTGYAASMQGQF